LTDVPERIFAAIGLAVICATGCATSSGPPAPATNVPAAPPLDEPAAVPSPAAAAIPVIPPPSAAVCEGRVGTDGIRRSSLKRTVDAGLGRWLQTVSVDRLLVRGRFKGWIIRSLSADDGCYTGVDLRVGDVVTRVNGRPVERPEEALVVWTALPTSAELVVDLVRDGQPRTVRFGIVDK
jgi:S1-C subfamily serine protease